MKKFRLKSLLSLSMCLLLLLGTTMPVIAADEEPSQGPAFLSFSGLVTQVLPWSDADGNIVADKFFVLVENEDGSLMNFLISPDTFMTTNNELKEGVAVVGYYRTSLPAILIYPPQQPAVVFAVSPNNDLFMVVDHFDTEGLSKGNLLQINSTENTVIVNSDGSTYTGAIGDKELIVFYDIATRCIPPQTTPKKIVVLEDWVIEIPPVETPASEYEQLQNVENLDIVVNGQIITAPPAYLSTNNSVMVPLRVIAEALGYNVSWEAETSSIMLDTSIGLQIDKDFYTYLYTAPIYLGTAPELHESLTYVPLQFFREVAKLNNAYVLEGQIVIDNDEKME